MWQKRSLRNHIDRMCKDCVYDSEAPGTWRQQVTLCTVLSCPLHPVRPTSSRISESLLRAYGLAQIEAELAPSCRHTQAGEADHG